MEFVVIVVWLSSAIFCAILANDKGYSNVAWFFGGLVFGLFALIAAAGLPDKKLRKYIRLIGEKQNAIKSEPEGGGDKWIEQADNWDNISKKWNAYYLHLLSKAALNKK